MSTEIEKLTAKVEGLEARLVATQDATVAALMTLANGQNHGDVQRAITTFREECDK